MKRYIKYLGVGFVLGLFSCEPEVESYDATGAFEAIETLISAQASGQIMVLDLQEGQFLEAQQYLGYVDTSQLQLQREQVLAQIRALMSRKPNVSVQIAALETQLEKAKTEQKRIENLLARDAATTKQKEDIQAQIELLEKQIAAQRTSLNTNIRGINYDVNTLEIQLDQLEDRITKSQIINPVKGHVLAKYSEVYEMTQMGKPLYKIADLSTLILKAYVTANQLSQIQLNQKVKVLTDTDQEQMRVTEGEIVWISDRAEFTPKTIKTKEERAQQVYAIKVEVSNPEGLYKLGMYGEIQWK